MNATIYVSHPETLTRARAFARAHGISLSQLIFDALRWYLDRVSA